MSEPTLLDAKGLTCPLPVLRARKMLKTLPAGGLLEVLATDPASQRDFPAFCTQTGYQLVEASVVEGGVFRYLIRKAV